MVLTRDSVNNLSQDLEIITFQVRTVAQERLIRKIGEITEEQLKQVQTGLVEILSY